MIIFQNNHIAVFQSAIFKMNSIVVVAEDFIFVADPGYLPCEIDEIRHYVNRRKRDKPVYLFFTHSDFDHIVGYGAFPDAAVIASREFVESPLQDRQVQDLILFDDDLYIDRLTRPVYPKVDHAIESDGEVLKAGKTEIFFYQAFGHTADGLAAVIPSFNILIAGDYLSDLEFPFVYASFKEYEKTLDKFMQINGNINKLIVIPGHGSIADTQSAIAKRTMDSKEYLYLVKEGASEVQFIQFLQKKNYRYTTNLRKRHQENQKVWEKQSLGT